LIREKGFYGVLYAKPARRVRNALSVDRELLVIVSTFQDQQPRTVQTAKEIIDSSSGRLEASAFIVAHRDPRGNLKLKRWGREQSLFVLPLYVPAFEAPSGDDLLRALSYEMFSHDPFDITGPVADDVNFYGRREEARELAKKLQDAQIRSCFGIRKIGKTSIIHRIIMEMKENYECAVVVIDGQRDALFQLTAAQLLNSIASTLNGSFENSARIAEVRPINDAVEVSAAAEKLRFTISKFEIPVVLVFDEVDYLTPGSPTNAAWREEFNLFWRNVRAIYQHCKLSDRNVSIFVSGVSSKWFSVESIDGIENAALAFVPEEYLSPLPRGAAVAMIRRLGKQAGLVFTDETAGQIADNCGCMPFWIRKACSFVHGRVEIGLRPFEPQGALIEEMLVDFVSSDGSAMSQVALAHLFRVFPDLREPVLACAEGRGDIVKPGFARVLEKYGVIGVARPAAISGTLMMKGVEMILHGGELEGISNESRVENRDGETFGDWADELAILSRRINVLERSLRGICVNFIRFSAMNIDKDRGSTRERILRGFDARRRPAMERLEVEEIIAKSYWLELVNLIAREWVLFERIFSDKCLFEENARIVNERPDAHAKELDFADIALQRRALTWLEDRISRI
ncbi:MAG: hypothetical protein ABJP82_13140, partial [Hyphomicrobiales bacterium]